MNTLERQVMASVAVIYGARMLMSYTALKVYVILFSVGVIARLVWVAKVLQNFAIVEHNGISATGNYVLYALGHTQFAVQLTLLVATAAFISLVVPLVLPTRTNRHAFA